MVLVGAMLAVAMVLTGIWIMSRPRNGHLAEAARLAKESAKREKERSAERIREAIADEKEAIAEANDRARDAAADSPGGLSGLLRRLNSRRPGGPKP